MWQTALFDITEAVSTGNISAIFSELEVLFLPTLALANLILLVKRVVDRVRKARASKQVRLATAS